MDPEQIWFFFKIFFPVFIAIAYIGKVAEDGHKKTSNSMPGVIHFAYLVISCIINFYIAKELISNTKLEINYGSTQNVECTIGFYKKVIGMEIELTKSTVQSVENTMLLFCVSKFLRLLDSSTLLSRETDKVILTIVSRKK